MTYELEHTTVPASATTDSVFLAQLLGEAAAKADGKPVVVLVDALDEAEDAGLAPSANRLYLPSTLPTGVFIVLTSREQLDYRLDVARREDIDLRDHDPQNLADIADYVRGYLNDHRADMTKRLSDWRVTAVDFVSILRERSQGNFMYLVHVLDDIRKRRLSAATLDRVQDLPQCLRAYYERHWRTMRALDQERFDRIYEPVLRILATVREPVTVDFVEEKTAVALPRIRDVIREWRQFLNEQMSDTGELHYRVYHSSFQSFLVEEGMGLRPSHAAIARSGPRASSAP